MHVQDVMTRDVQTVAPGTPAEDAWNLMRTKGIHHLVVTSGATVVGVLSDRDTGGRGGARTRQGRTVGDLMTSPAVVVPPETTVRRAANLMRGRSIGSLVVGTGRKVSGIVTISDLLELVGRGMDRTAEVGKRWTLRHRTPHRKARRAAGVW